MKNFEMHIHRSDRDTSLFDPRNVQHPIFEIEHIPDAVASSFREKIFLVFGSVVVIGVVSIVMYVRREQQHNLDHFSSVQALPVDNREIYEAAVQTYPQEIAPSSSDSPHFILEIRSEDLYPEKMRELIHRALKECIESGAQNTEVIDMEIRTDKHISPEELDKLIEQALQPHMRLEDYPTA